VYEQYPTRAFVEKIAGEAAAARNVVHKYLAACYGISMQVEETLVALNRQLLVAFQAYRKERLACEFKGQHPNTQLHLVDKSSWVGRSWAPSTWLANGLTIRHCATRWTPRRCQ